MIDSSRPFQCGGTDVDWEMVPRWEVVDNSGVTLKSCEDQSKQRCICLRHSQIFVRIIKDIVSERD